MSKMRTDIKGPNVSPKYKGRIIGNLKISDSNLSLQMSFIQSWEIVLNDHQWTYYSLKICPQPAYKSQSMHSDAKVLRVC